MTPAEILRCNAGARSSAVRRQTGTTVTVYNALEAGLDDGDGRYPWSTACEDHGFTCSHRTRKIAEAHAVDPRGWCETCNYGECAEPGCDAPGDRDGWCGVHAHDADGWPRPRP